MAARTFANEIIYGTPASVAKWLEAGADVNETDEYGFNPLIEAAIVQSPEITTLLLERGAEVNQSDVTGRTALHWAVDNHDLPLCKLLLEHKANANAYTTGGQPVLVMPLLRQQQSLKKLLYQYGANLNFAQDFINTKLLGHRYQLFGQVDIVNAEGRFVELDLEGFFLEFTLSVVRHSLERYRNNFAARRFRGQFNYLGRIIDSFAIASELLKYQRYTVDITNHAQQIDLLLSHDLLLIPVAYRGHAITYVKFGNLWVRCDRGETGRAEGTVMIYQINNHQALTPEFLKYLIYKPQTEEFITQGIKEVLGLTPVFQLPLSAQITGNCSWANVEASIPAMMFLLMLKKQNNDKELLKYQKAALSFYQQWLEWDKDRALDECIQSFYYASRARKASKAALLGSVLFFQCNYLFPKDIAKAEKILSILSIPEYSYVLKSYIQVYWKTRKTRKTPAGENLMHLLDICGIKI